MPAKADIQAAELLINNMLTTWPPGFLCDGLDFCVRSLWMENYVLLQNPR